MLKGQKEINLIVKSSRCFKNCANRTIDLLCSFYVKKIRYPYLQQICF